MTGYAGVPGRPPLLYIRVNVPGVGEVDGIVDSGASISVKRYSLVRRFLKPKGVLRMGI